MAGYIDLHTHILPAIDDGPRTMNEAVMLARALVAVGYDTVVATPHSFEGRPSPALILERLADLQEELDRQGVPLNLLPGSEPHLEPNITERLKNKEIQTLNNTRYLYVELPFQPPLPIYTEQLLAEIRALGYQPIIPHPERVEALQNDYQLIHRLHQAGAIFQLTWGALTGWLGKVAENTAHYLVDANLAHLFATDAHNAASRLLTVAKAIKTLNQISTPGRGEELLIARPQKLLADQELGLTINQQARKQ